MSILGNENITSFVQVLEALHQLEDALPGLNATQYLSAVGTVILFYDILLLLPEERSLIWRAPWSSDKALFLINRYLSPLLFIINNHSLGALSAAGLSTTFCRVWLSITALLGAISLAIASFFVARRVYVLSSRNVLVKTILIFSFIVVYLVTSASVVLIVIYNAPNVEFSSIIGSCVLVKKPNFLIMAYGAPIVLDVLIFLLTCYNAFDRPRHIDSSLVIQLITDGLSYFLSLLSLRVFNIISIAVLDVQFSELGGFFIWAVITTLVNRMIIKRGVQAEPDLILYDSVVRKTPFWSLSVDPGALRNSDNSNESIQHDPGVTMMKA